MEPHQTSWTHDAHSPTKEEENLVQKINKYLLEKKCFEAL